MRSQRAAEVLLGFASVVIMLVCVSTFSHAKPQTEPHTHSINGPDLFRSYCAVCHGTDAHGAGPMATNLKSKVPDLTVLARNNKGKFPAARLHSVMEGTDPAAAHGSREMPVWGPIFHEIENDQDVGNVRIDNLLKYLESIQRK